MSENPKFVDFPIDFYNAVNDDETLYDELRDRLEKLRGDHTDMTSASANIREANSGTQSGVECTITVEIVPDPKVSTVVAPDARIALKAALDGLERQIREHRDRMRGY